MVQRVATVAFEGIEARAVDVQVQIAPGLPRFNVVRLPDKAVSEARERVRAALVASGLALPARRITVNLAPADLPKEGSHCDLPIALLLLVAGIPAAAPPSTTSAPDLCLTAGAITYQVASGFSAADLRVNIVAPAANAALRIALITDVQSADFAVVDDPGVDDENACTTAGTTFDAIWPRDAAALFTAVKQDQDEALFNTGEAADSW
jgi:magnesium chelatase family protein